MPANANVAQLQRRIQKAAAKKRKKKLQEPARRAQEAQFAAEHAGWSDAALYGYAKELRRRLGKRMTPAETVGYAYLVKRLGPWDCFMGQIGKELQQERQARASHTAQDMAWGEAHRDDSDQQLLAYLRERLSNFDAVPDEDDIVGGHYLAHRFGGWDEAVRLAGAPGGDGTLP